MQLQRFIAALAGRFYRGLVGAFTLGHDIGLATSADRERRENSLRRKITPDPRHRRGALSIAPLRSFS